jgi:hypothetical protein
VVVRTAAFPPGKGALLTVFFPPLVQPCQLMIARTRLVSQTIIEVEAKWGDDSIIMKA